MQPIQEMFLFTSNNMYKMCVLCTENNLYTQWVFKHKVTCARETSTTFQFYTKKVVYVVQVFKRIESSTRFAFLKMTDIGCVFNRISRDLFLIFIFCLQTFKNCCVAQSVPVSSVELSGIGYLPEGFQCTTLSN